MLAEEDTGPKRLKMVIVGDGDCGKTCLLHRFATDKFYTRYIPTVFEVQAKTVYYKDQEVSPQIRLTKKESLSLSPLSLLTDREQ